jgi:hypothetical protein
MLGFSLEGENTGAHDSGEMGSNPIVPTTISSIGLMA